jgi:hypothetical protein
MRWWRVILWTAPVTLAVMFVAMINLDKPVGYLLMVFPVAWCVAGSALCCPRCGKHIQDTGRGYYGGFAKAAETCIGCGRGKRDIWPFQRLLRPEPRDTTETTKP